MAIQRTKSRKLALKILYQNEFHKIPSEKQIDIVVQSFFEQVGLVSENEKKYCVQILKDLSQKKEVIDEKIKQYSQNWALERMALIDLNIMRIATLEMLYYPEIPNKVSINEALELSKIFGSEKSSSFINGILNKILENNTLDNQDTKDDQDTETNQDTEDNQDTKDDQDIN